MIDDFECCELAAHLIGIGDEFEDEDEVWEKLYDEHELTQESFCWLINELVPLIDVGKSPLTDTIYKGFSQELKNGLKMWLVKMEVKKT